MPNGDVVEDRTEITTERLVSIIGIKEVELVTLRDQVQFLLARNAELVAQSKN